jgi:hypothetical protein
VELVGGFRDRIIEVGTRSAGEASNDHIPRQPATAMSLIAALSSTINTRSQNFMTTQALEAGPSSQA